MTVASKDPTYVYHTRVTNIVDGDTYDISIDLGFDTHIIDRMRLDSVDTAETYGVSSASEEYEAGVAHREAVETWVDTAQPVDDEDFPLVLHSSEYSRGSFGRVLADLWSPVQEEWLSDYLVETFQNLEKE